jgi:hypothetical protein
MGQANVKKWVDDIMPLLTDDYPLGVDSFASHVLPLDEAPHAYTKKVCPPRCFAQRFDWRASG